MSLWCFRFRLKLLTFNLRAPLLNSPASFANSLMDILHACWLVEGEGSKGHYVPQTSSNFFTFGNVSSKRSSVEPQNPCSSKHRISDAFDTFTRSCLEITAVRMGVWQATSRRCIESHWIQRQNWQYVFNLLAPELFFFNFSTPVYKMWIIQETKKLELWNKLHFEEEKTESIYHV